MKKINLSQYSMGGIPRLFERQNVCVCGMMGTGKDVLFGNVIARLKKPYISNLNYGYDRIVWNPQMLNYNNSWLDLMENTIKKYNHPFPDGWHTYISDLGIYLPATYCAEIAKKYPNISTALPMTRQITGGWFHANAQVPEKIYDKIRDHFDVYLMCKRCWVLFKGRLVVHWLVKYDRYQSCVDRVPPFPLRRPLVNKDRMQQYEIQKSNYLIKYGEVKPIFLIYRNKSKHDTRGFKEMFANGA